MTTRPDPEDLTARARIRDAALQHFGEHGFDAATIRGIAESAGVSSGLVRHHFGNKQRLRDACDEYLIRLVRQVNDTKRNDPSFTLDHLALARAGLGRHQQYLVRSLVEGGAVPLFDGMVSLTEEWLVEYDAERTEPPDVDRTIRATVMTAMSLGITVLHEHVSRKIGADALSEEGQLKVVRAIVDFLANPLLGKDQTKNIRATLDRMSATDSTHLEEHHHD